MTTEAWIDVVLTYAGIFGLLAGFIVPPIGALGAIVGLIGLALAVWERVIKPTYNSDRFEIPPPTEETKYANALLFIGKSVFLLLLFAWTPVALGSATKWLLGR